MGMGMGKLGVFAGVAGSVALAGSAEAAFQSLSMDLVNSGNQGKTYRLFANVDSGARVDAVFGNAQSDLSISLANGASFYQNANAGPASTDTNSNFFPFVPSMEWDSFVTIGALYQNGGPVDTANNLSHLNIDFAPFESGGGDIFTDNGTWFVTPSDVQGLEVGGQVLLGQFTVYGGIGDASDIIGQISVQGQDSGGATWSAIGASWSTVVVPEPSTALLIGLGLTGLAGKGRRRNRS